MSTIKFPWTMQPQSVPRINWANPITNGLQVFFVPDNVIASGSASNSLNHLGKGVSTDGSAQYQFVPKTWEYGPGVTIAALSDCNWRTATTYERLATVRTGTKSTGIQLSDAGTKSIQVFCNAAVETNGYLTCVLPASATTGVHLFVGTTEYSLASHKAYVDGIKLSGSTGGNGSVSLDAGASGLDIGRTQYDSTNYFGRYNWIGLVVAWNRALSEPEVSEFSKSPWQIFAP